MAKLRMTYKNLKALRKSKEYQALLVDLVSVGVVPKATAEGLLGYNIPANLIGGTESSGTDNPIDDPETGGEGSGDTSTPIVVPVKIFVDGVTPITVGTYTIPSSWETIDYLNLDTESDAYLFGDNFAPNENWSSDYNPNNGSYMVDGVPGFYDGTAIAPTTAPSELPENAYIGLSLQAVDSGSSSS